MTPPTQNIRTIRSLDEPLAAVYRNMKDKELARDGVRFIAEGEQVVRRLLNSGFGVESVLVAERKLERIAPLVSPATPLLCGPDEMLAGIIGFEFHSGVLACGIRPPSPALDDCLPPAPRRARALLCQEITNTENLGSLIRVATAFGADAMVLGERCCDPFFRQSVRVSMGTIFSLPMVRSENLLDEIERLHAREFETWAMVLSEDAEPIQNLKSPNRAAIVLGNEAQGLDRQSADRCSRRVVVPMQRGTDSLNVAIAAAVALYQLTRNA